MLKTFVLSVVILWLAGAVIRAFSKIAANSAKQRREETDLYEKVADRVTSSTIESFKADEPTLKSDRGETSSFQRVIRF